MPPIRCIFPRLGWQGAQMREGHAEKGSWKKPDPQIPSDSPQNPISYDPGWQKKAGQTHNGPFVKAALISPTLYKGIKRSLVGSSPGLTSGRLTRKVQGYTAGIAQQMPTLQCPSTVSQKPHSLPKIYSLRRNLISARPQVQPQMNNTSASPSLGLPKCLSGQPGVL